MVIKPWFAHFQTIKNNPYKFFMWFCASIVISLSSIWLPLLIGKLIGVDIRKEILGSQPLIFFSIVLLSDALLTSVSIEGSFSNKISTGIRGISIVLTIIAILVFSSFSMINYFSKDKFEMNVQFYCLAIAIIIGIYIWVS